MAIGQNPMTVEAYTEAYNRNLKDMARDIFNDSEREYDKISKVESTDRLTNEFQTDQSVSAPIQGRDLEPIPQTAPVKGYKSVIRIKNYKVGITLEETLMRTAVFKDPINNAKDMMRSTVTLKDQTAVDFFNNGFTDALSTNITEFDGTARAFFSTGHYYENGASTWSNYYNVGVPPTPEVVYLIINNYLKRLKDFGGENFVDYGKEFTIVTPSLNSAFGMAADEIVMSSDRPDTSDRATNVLKSIRLKHVSLNQLTSSSKWFIMVPTTTSSFPLCTLEMIPYEVSPLQSLASGGNPDAFYTRCRTQFGVGFNKQYRGVVAIGA